MNDDKRAQLMQDLNAAKEKLNEIEVDSLSDEELEDVAGGTNSLWCCCNGNGGDGDNGDGGDGGDNNGNGGGPTLEVPVGP